MRRTRRGIAPRSGPAAACGLESARAGHGVVNVFSQSRLAPSSQRSVPDCQVYTAANPVLDHLVERVHHWPGVNGLGALLAGRPLRATRPLHFFRPDGPMPDALELPPPYAFL